MKHNGLANLFLGIIYGAIFACICAFVDAPDNIALMAIAIIFMWTLTSFLYLTGED